MTVAVASAPGVPADLRGRIVAVELASDALPTHTPIRASYDAGAAEVQWVVNAYLLPLSALLLLGGALGDHFGRRRLLAIGTALFAISSLLCALAPSLPLLLAGRAVQGIGAALLLPNSLALLNAAFAGEAPARRWMLRPTGPPVC